MKSSDSSDRRSLWRAADGRLRAGWRLLTWFLGVFVLAAALNIALAGRAGASARAAILAAAVAAVSLLVWRWLDGLPPRRTLLAPGGAVPRAMGGLALGVGLIAAVGAILAVAGAFRFEPRSCQAPDQGAYLLRTLVLFAGAGAAEELLFRGYPLFALREAAGRVAAVVATAALFSVVHAANPHFGWLAGLNVALVGVILGAWVLQTGSIWGAVGLHIGWNWGLAAGIALPLSGLRFPPPCYAGRVEGASWLTGGEFGMEASVLATVSWGALGLVLVIRRRRGRGGG